MTVYSPSQTSTYMRCPMLRALRREGWIRKAAGKRELAGTIGTAFAAGVGAYNTLRQAHEQGGGTSEGIDRKSAAEASVGIARGILAAHLQELERTGQAIHETDDGYLQAMDGRVTKAVSKYVLTDPLPPTWRIMGVEQEFPEHGNCRADLIVRDDRGLAVVDYKSKVFLKAQYEAQTLREYANHDQMFHYAWAASDVYGEPCQRYHIALCVFEPSFKFQFVSQEMNPETSQVWLASRRRVWSLMAQEDRGEAVPYIVDKHSDQFGMCDFYDACFRYRYDPVLMEHGYINTKKEEK